MSLSLDLEISLPITVSIYGGAFLMSPLSRIHDVSKILHIHKYMSIALTCWGLHTEFFCAYRWHSAVF